MGKSFKEEMYEASIKAGIMPIHHDFHYEENGVIGGVTLEGELLVIVGKKIDGGKTNIVVTNLGNVLNSDMDALTDEKLCELGMTIVKKLQEE